VNPSTKLSTSDDRLQESLSGNGTTVERSKLFKSKREVLILIGLSLIIFSFQCGESIIAPFFTLDVSKIIKFQQRQFE